MIINSIKFYKTPLDIGHSRIIDVVGASNSDEIISSYNEALSNYEDYDVYENVNPKSVRIINKRAELVIQEEYFNIRDYNYCVINGDTYFFIESISQLNDVTLKPSCSVTLLWDYWGNNISELLSNSKGGNSIISTRHINRFDENGNYKYFTNENVDLRCKYDIKSDRYKVLFLRLLFNNISDDTGVLRFDYSFQYTNDEGNQDINKPKVFTYPQTDNVRIMYVPIALIDLYENKRVYSATIKNNSAIFLSDDTYVTQSLEYDLDYRFYQLSPTDEGYIISANLTFYSPFDYSVNVGTFEIDITFENKPMIKLGNDLISTIKYNSNGSVDTSYSLYAFMLPFSIDDKFVTHFYEYVDTITKTVNYKTLCIDNVINVPNVWSGDINLTDNYFDPKLLLPPYNTIVAVVKGNEYDLSPKSISSELKTQLNVIISNGFPLLTIKSDNDIIYTPSAINNTGDISFTADYVERFLNRNGAQYESSVYLNKLTKGLNLVEALLPTANMFYGKSLSSGITSYTLNAVESGIQFADVFAKDVAFKEDMSMMPDIVVNSPYAEFDQFIQDDIKIYHKYCVDSLSLKVKMKNLYSFGYNIDELGDPLENFRVWFDYVQTSKCKILHTINEEDKIEIQNMFNRGVHKFHFNKLLNSFKSDLTLDPTNHSNYEYSEI